MYLYMYLWFVGGRNDRNMKAHFSVEFYTDFVLFLSSQRLLINKHRDRITEQPWLELVQTSCKFNLCPGNLEENATST